MHISEGVLSAPVLLTGAALTAAGVAVGLKKMDTEKVPHEHKIRIRFAEGAVDEIMQQAVREDFSTKLS